MDSDSGNKTTEKNTI